MKRTPILFTTPMVVAVRTGAKDVTRRLTGLERLNEAPDDWVPLEGQPPRENATYVYFYFVNLKTDQVLEVRCPYGKAGAVLWVRETWRTEKAFDHFPPVELTGEERRWYEADGPAPDWAGKVRVSIHMPERFSREDLELLEVRPERLHAMTQDEARREGVTPIYAPAGKQSYIPAFELLWDKINPKQSWFRNPWVWALTFKRTSP